jgi:signal transduction histidine kinase
LKRATLLRTRILASLVLIVLLPTALLAWLGLRMAGSEQAVVEAQFRTLVQGRLAGIDAGLQDYFHALQDDLAQQALQADGSAEGWRRLALASPQVRQVLVFGADGQLQHPPPAGPWVPGEQAFLQRVAALVDNPALLTQGVALAGPDPRLASPAQAGLVRKEAAGSDPAQAAAGWYAWHWNAELRHIRWWRDGPRVIGFELAPVLVASDLVASLPATGRTGDGTLTRLVDGSGRVLYEWGQHRPAAGEASLATWPLAHPLGSWKLDYFAPLPVGQAAGRFGLLAALLAIAATLTALAVWLWREHTRELREAEQRVSFVNQVSHELKTPLTNIRLYAELLQDALDAGDEPPAATGAQRYAGVIVSESQRLSRLIGNVLDFGRFQRAEVRLQPAPACVDEVVRRCLAAFQPALAAKGIAVRFEGAAAAQVLVDVPALEQVLNNLVGNVEKYAAAGGWLQVATTQDARTTTLDVRDRGPGIPAAERERVFEPFYRSSAHTADGVAGTGIGLDIARRLARLHGGDVTLEPLDGPGAWFRVTLATPAADGMPTPREEPA